MMTTKPVWHGIVLVAGGAVGAGMFALPVVSVDAWSAWSALGLVCVWWFTYLAATLLLDTNLAVLRLSESTARVIQGPPTSFDTLVNRVLGARWAMANNLSLVFIMMILMYAYISAGASIMGLTLEQFNVRPLNGGLGQHWLSLLFAVVVALLIWLGTGLVARISGMLMILMALSFFVVALSLAPHVNVTALLETQLSFMPFVLASLPVYVAAFACAGLVPSLVKH